MKKIIKPLLWLCLGAVLMMAGQAAADTISFTGKKVAGETDLRVNGSDIGSVIIVDNKSFAEVRALANATGMSVSYDKSGVDLNSMAAPEQLQYLHTQQEYLTKQIEDLNSAIDHVNSVVIPEWQAKIDAPGRDSTKKSAQDAIDSLKQGNAEKESKIVELQAQLDSINAQIAKLEAEPEPSTDTPPDTSASPSDSPEPSPSPTDSGVTE